MQILLKFFFFLKMILSFTVPLFVPSILSQKGIKFSPHLFLTLLTRECQCIHRQCKVTKFGRGFFTVFHYKDVV